MPRNQRPKSLRPRPPRASDRTRAQAPTVADSTPMERIYHIHAAVMAGGFPNCSALAEALGVTSKTVQRDINFMREHLGLPLDYEETKHGFRYKGVVADFPAFEMTAEEAATLFFARTALEPIRGTKLAGHLDKAFQKIARPLQERISFEWAELDEALSVKQTGLPKTDGESFTRLAKAVLERREVQFDYQKVGADKKESRSVQPYHLGQVDNGWYLIGFDLARRALRTFALARLGNVKVSATKFQRPADFDAHAYLRHSFGVWREEGDAKPVDIRVEFTGYAARLVAERLWHESQEIRELNDKGTRIEVRMKLANLPEVTRWVLSWGSQAKVISPPELVKAVRDEARAIAAGK